MICMTHTGKAIVNLADADHMLFVTTSNYSSGAIEYAASSGVSLINGSELLKLLSTYGFLHKNDVTIAPSEWQLTVSDLKPYVPTDIYSRFFL
ncbi:MAG: restriction endonuclease [[Clostridium] leptum]